MVRICPNPTAWSLAFERLTKHAECCPCHPASPPVPLILAGWSGTNDVEKKQRWEETVSWARANGCAETIDGIPDSDFHFVQEPSTYMVGPFGGPMYRPWDYEPKSPPRSEDLDRHLEMLRSQWSEIVGADISRATRPIAFTGRKARCLLIHADPTIQPPWGSWFQLSELESERRTFTAFRSAINKAIAPHEVDHVEFTRDR